MTGKENFWRSVRKGIVAVAVVMIATLVLVSTVSGLAAGSGEIGLVVGFVLFITITAFLVSVIVTWGPLMICLVNYGKS